MKEIGVNFHGCPSAGHSEQYCKGCESGDNHEGALSIVRFNKKRQ